MAANIYSDNCMTQLIYPIQLKIMDRLSHIIWLTNRKATGRPEVLAGKIGVRKTRLSELINMIRNAGIEIEYDRTVESYHFRYGKKYYLQCEIEEQLVDEVA